MNSPVDSTADPVAAAARDLATLDITGDSNFMRLPIYRRLDDLQVWLEKTIAYALDPEPEHLKAADWLLDNDYQISRAIVRLQQDLPQSFYDRLPVLKESGTSDSHSPAPGIPRAYAISQTLLSATSFQLSRENSITFLRAFQQDNPLTIAELWAIPSMLRMACLETLIDAFCQLRGQDSPPFEITRFTIAGRSALPTDRISRAITNLTTIHAIRWRDVVDRTSVVESILSTDPSGTYPAMNFATRDLYRRAVEEIAFCARISEQTLAQRAIDMASSMKKGSRQNHVGFWLIGDGRAGLEARCKCRLPMHRSIRNFLLARARPLYAFSIMLLLFAALLVPVWLLRASEVRPALQVLGVVLSLIPASILSITLVNWIVTLVVPPRQLPTLDFKKGIPQDCPTAVVVPVIIRSAHEIEYLFEKMELRWLSNPDPMLRFVLMSDLPDSSAERQQADDEIEKALSDAVKALNERYDDKNRPFILVHRKRRYNSGEDCWMGWERKRGKIEQLNRYILGEDIEDFALCEGTVEDLRQIRYVIVLDADTNLPPLAAARLVGKLAHPLNKAEWDPQAGEIISGYSVLQPRIETLPSGGSSSIFSLLFAGETAVDIYSNAVSDIYQDLFGTGIFVGKGIYEVEPFYRSLTNRVPENTILSHDLFEGIHARVALVTDIILYENYPASYPEYALRIHRWWRGDWQLLPWLGTRVSTTSGQKMRNPMSWLDRWKIIDNLRRSLIPPALLLFFIGGWMLLPESALIWTLMALAAPGIYMVSEVYGVLAGGVREGFLGNTLHRMKEKGGRWFLIVTFLVSDTMISLDALMRTLWRLSVSRQRLLEWRTAAHVSTSFNTARARYSTWRLMWPSSVFAVLLAGSFAIYDLADISVAMPVLVLWFAAPEIALWIGKPRRVRREKLDHSQTEFLKRAARRTWHFFETFAGPEDHWLPPDNFQEVPTGRVAHRTSPTNIGMFLVSALAARDLGFITNDDFMARTENLLDTMDKLEKYKGHILNWYDTRTLKPLEPQYVSTVDSGNLAVSLIALAQGLREGKTAPAFQAHWQGLECTLDVFTDAVQNLPAVDPQSWMAAIAPLRQVIREAENGAIASSDALELLVRELWPEVELVVDQATSSTDALASDALVEVHAWLERFDHHLHAMLRDISSSMPWLHQLRDVPPDLTLLADRVSATLATATDSSELLAVLHTIDCDISQIERPEQSRIWIEQLKVSVQSAIDRLDNLHSELDDLARRAEVLAFDMDFKFLYDPAARLFVIGYDVSSGQIDTSHYDLLATEARVASFFAIAKHDAPIEHWFFLGRPITRLQSKPVILSWNGSMFEYLMPPLFLPSHRDTLLGESESTCVNYQRAYARKRMVPWGISESAFGVTDADGNYQYRAFGAPGLGIRRGLTDDLVIAPYASALALCVWPGAAVGNLRRLASLGALRIYGFIDALDYTPGRAPDPGAFRPVRTYMAHHQGMIMVAIANVLTNDRMPKRVMSHPDLHAQDLLLQERIPWEAPTEKGRIEETWDSHTRREALVVPGPWLPAVQNSHPQMQFVGNGRMASWISQSGGGGLFWHGNALTRWQPDPARDAMGCWIYVRDADTGLTWSVADQPCSSSGEEARTVFHHQMVETFRRENKIAVRTETTIAPDDDAEIRRVSITNEDDEERIIEFTSYAEIVLAPPLDDERHPAFSKLFVGSRWLSDVTGLMFERRPRRPESKPPVLLHRLAAADSGVELVGFESDRAKFIGRNGSASEPIGMQRKLSETTGWTLDPVMALRVQVRLKPMEARKFSFVTIAGESAATVRKISERFSTPNHDWVFRDSALATARAIARLKVAPADLPHLQSLGSMLVQPCPGLRAVPNDISANSLGLPDLWRFGISGDLPILLINIGPESGFDLIELLVRAHRLWAHAGLIVDIVILHRGIAGYDEPLRERLHSILRDIHAEGQFGRRGGIHLLTADQMDAPSRRAFMTAASVVLNEDGISLETKLERARDRSSTPPRFEPAMAESYGPTPVLQPAPGLLFDNGYGGFDGTSREYLIHLNAGANTPAPWVNVLANDRFGTIVSEAGLGFTWAINSGERRLTPWTNDPVSNSPGEILYLRDEATGEFWTPTPQPLGREATTRIHHGMGYTRWLQNSRGLEQELAVFVPTEDPVKVVTLRLKNLTDHDRRITATYFAEWVLGAVASASKPHVVCEYDSGRHAILANNPWNPEFAAEVAFLAASRPPHSLTGNLTDFFGENGTVDKPAGIQQWDLGGRFTSGSSACAAYQMHIDIAAGGSEEISFILGQGGNRAHAERLIEKWTTESPQVAEQNLVRDYWKSQLGAVQVRTPDPAFDLLINHWLLYQTISCRIAARAGFYQAGGAYGFRDQLQDVLAVLHCDPDRVRQHILLAAGFQFEEGDALHWWHPPSGRGVRTKCSDDYLWLPFVTARYVETTGDDGIFDVQVPFLKGDQLGEDEYDRYARYETGETGSLYEHCQRALDRMMRTGAHGLPLIGTGDWNDGMDRLGDKGRGESIWLAWFQIANVARFAPIAKKRGRSADAERWLDYADRLKQAIDDTAWDGRWFLRAFDDEAEAWGSHGNEECKIDSIAQSWSVLCGIEPDERVKQAMEAAKEHLVDAGNRLALLLAPPFHHTTADPGYIKAYPPGVRENGGQYSHAAAWLGLAFAGLGDGDMAWQIFDIINPIPRSQTTFGADRYLREPYVLPGDVAALETMRGQGGWSWYTGAAGWTWQLGVRGILGLDLRHDHLVIDPVLPKNWGGAELQVRHAGHEISIRIEDPHHVGHGVSSILLNRKRVAGTRIQFPANSQRLNIMVLLGAG